ncbi:unnamed protein product [Durusdinium trenchii]|uniref:PI3K/PI4K catalytic domain-containing protein n=1 Tax=Durusdinium trenchii TaxID=1381693 RepID=A0ABP0PJK2_9DINO
MASEASMHGVSIEPEADETAQAEAKVKGLEENTTSVPLEQRSESDGEDRPSEWILPLLRGRRVGEMVHFPEELKVAGQVFTSAYVERDFRTASGAHLLRLYPGGLHFIVKFADVRQEHAMMMALKEMNRRWQQHAVEVCGQPVHALTYQIFPIGSSGGLIEAVLGCRTLRELKKLCREPQERVYEALGGESQKLDTLAASTTAYLTACYALGVRDGHDDNIMLREDGSLFRVDFGFVFGATPEIDTPQTVVARAVTFALGERWLEVVAACGDSLTALTGDSYGSPPAFDCLSSVPELEAYLPLARSHTASLSLARFCHDVSCADQWSFSRAAKNTLREAVQFLRDQAGLGPEQSDEAEETLEPPEWISGSEPLSDPFMDLNLFLDSGVDLLGLYRALEDMPAESDSDLMDWFLTGPVADLFTMANEGLSREDLQADPTVKHVGHLPQQSQRTWPEPAREGDPKVRIKKAREMLSKLYEGMAALRKPHLPNLPFPVDPRGRSDPKRSLRPSQPTPASLHGLHGSGYMGGSPVSHQEWPNALRASCRPNASPILPVQLPSLPMNDPFARTPPATPREPFPQLLEVMSPDRMPEAFVSQTCRPANTYKPSCGMYQVPYANASSHQQLGARKGFGMRNAMVMVKGDVKTLS